VAVRTRLEITWLPGAERIAPVHRRAGQQMDNLCGPYWTSVLLRAHGFDADEEDVAVAAGTLLPSVGDPTTWVPPGQANRASYRRSLMRTDDPDASGTSVTGLLASASELSDDVFRFLPIRGRGGVPTDGEALRELIDLLERHPGWRAAPILNLRVGLLWGTQLSFDEAFAYLSGSKIEAPEPEWDVGHFVNVAGLVRADARTMLWLRDSYPSLGWHGYHLQPLEAVGEGIRRYEGHEGGCLLFVASEAAPAIEHELKEVGFDIGGWDNGTPYEGGGR
jgi:hypothetical protein